MCSGPFALFKTIKRLFKPPVMLNLSKQFYRFIESIELLRQAQHDRRF